MRRAAELGYHGISLAYVNTFSVNFDVCQAHPGDSGCPEKARLEILLGTESGYNPPSVDEANSAYRRLVALLRYLETAYPQEGWGQYLAGDVPRWERIALGGHSQGGGHAAMTAKLHSVARVLLFDATEPSAWTRGAFTTPPERMFGFVHTLEPIYQPIVRSWTNLRLPGPLTNVDGLAPPFGGSNQLSTSRTDCRGDAQNLGFYHNCPVVDEYLPLDGTGESVFRPVWDYMLTAVRLGDSPPAVGATILVSPPGESWLDPELARLEGTPWMTFQDGTGRVYMARLREEDGTVAETHLVGDGGAPLLSTFNGPEFGVDASGAAIYYSRTVGSGIQAARVTWTLGAFTGDLAPSLEVVTSGDTHFTPLPSTDPTAASTRLILLRRPPSWGTALWLDLAEPGVEHPLAFLQERTDGDARWVVGTRVIATNTHPDHPGQIALLDTETGQVTRVSNVADPPIGFPYGWSAPEAGGRLAALGTLSSTDLGIWLPDGQGGFALSRTLTAPPGAPPVIGSPEPFVAGGRSYVSLTLAEEERIVPGETRQEVWIMDLQGSLALRCDDGTPGPVTRVDPEVIFLQGRAFVYYYVMDQGSSEVYACATGIGA